MIDEYTRLNICSACGAYVTDRSGTQYVDLNNVKGGVLLGHADPDVFHAVHEALSANVLGSPASPIVQEVKSSIAGHFSLGSDVAFFHTGTAAVRAASLALRRATQRHLIVSAGYHGWDGMWGPAPTPFCVNESGVFDCMFQTARLEEFLTVHGSETAGAILSPDYIHNSPQLIGQIIAICRQHSIPVISDEVKNGFRYGKAASVCHFGYSADAYVLSKGLANGWPLACVVGPEWLMEPLQNCHSTATFHPGAFAASMATLQKLASHQVAEGIAEAGGRFMEQAGQMLQESNLPIEIVGSGNLFQFVVETSELETDFYAEVLREGLCLFVSDNQSPSMCFKGEALTRALDSLERALLHLARRAPHLLGVPISRQARWRAALAQMDGFPDNAIDCPTIHALLNCVD